MNNKISSTAANLIANYVQSYAAESDWGSNTSIIIRRKMRIESYTEICNYILNLEQNQKEI